MEKNVTCRAMGVGEVPFINNNYSVLHAVVHKVNPEVGTRCIPLLAALHWEPNVPGQSKEGEPI